jgi:leucyl-tRNA synthetase
MWLEVLHKPSSIQLAQWPTNIPQSDPKLAAVREYVRTTSSNITSAEAQASKKITKGKAAAFDPRRPKCITIFVAKNFPAWQDKYIELVRTALEKSSLDDDKSLNAQVAKIAGKGPEMKKAMPFVQGLKKRINQGEKEGNVFERKLPFDEVGILEEMRKGLMRTTGCKDVVITEVDETNVKTLPGLAESAVPGQPSFLFENVE